jgi:fatty acid desaturase
VFRSVEWPTLILIAGCYAVWALATMVIAPIFLPLALVITTLTLTLHSSLQHEVLHGHPFACRPLNEALVALPLGLVIPFGRFRDLHLAHHRDEHLTDPYDDPESNFFDAKVWARLPGLARAILVANNTLLGRMLIGPAIGVAVFLRSEATAIATGDPTVIRAWAFHLVGLVPIAVWLSHAGMPLWAYCLACYAAMSILKIRTFLEHRVHEKARGRSVVVEDRGPLAFFFLNNNLHVVHHCKPHVAWYKLPALYAGNREEFLRRNDGYCYPSYWAVFHSYFLRRKDPVVHPIWTRD